MKGVKLNHGYVQVCITRKGFPTYYKNFGKDSSLARELAFIHAGEKYKELLLGTFGIRQIREMKFKEAWPIFLKRHYIDYRDQETNAPRSKKSIECATAVLNILSRFFDNYLLHEIDVALVKKYKEERLKSVKPATVNREKGMLTALFNQFTLWVEEKSIRPVKLPAKNPAALVPIMTETGRERIPDTWELTAAYNWCVENDLGLWEGIESALLTALRKSDLVALDGSLTVKGIQQKTGEKFDLPIVLDKPVNLVNYHKRWRALRTALGWLPAPKGNPANPKHTTWHDLRHWAPTLLGESGFSTKIIQSYGGWRSEKSAEKYTNIRRKALEPAVSHIKGAIERIKDDRPAD